MTKSNLSSCEMARDAYVDLLERALLQYIERFGLTDLARQSLCKPKSIDFAKEQTGEPCNPRQ
jgi:hypothetical protein